MNNAANSAPRTRRQNIEIINSHNNASFRNLSRWSGRTGYIFNATRFAANGIRDCGFEVIPVAGDLYVAYRV